jgi:hypothetical protein
MVIMYLAIQIHMAIAKVLIVLVNEEIPHFYETGRSLIFSQHSTI